MAQVAPYSQLLWPEVKIKISLVSLYIVTVICAFHRLYSLLSTHYQSAVLSNVSIVTLSSESIRHWSQWKLVSERDQLRAAALASRPRRRQETAHAGQSQLRTRTSHVSRYVNTTYCNWSDRPLIYGVGHKNGPFLKGRSSCTCDDVEGWSIYYTVQFLFGVRYCLEFCQR